MGKVYEAAQRAQKEEVSRNLSTLNLPGAVTQTAAEAREQEGQFDFIDYSLNALPADEVAQRNQKEAETAFVRKALVEPARQVTLDLSRIDPHLTMFFDSSLLASEQYNKLAISMISEKDERPLKKILIASSRRGEGRTCVALNLACALARARQRVLVLDADFHRPSVLRLLGLEAEIGLTDVINQNQPPGKATVRVLPSGFQILPTREQVENSAELLTSPRFKEVLTMLEPEYDFILIDSSPLLRVSDANLLLRLTDATVFVIRAGKTSSLQLSKAVASLTQDHIFGVVLNRTEHWTNALNG